MAFALPRPRPTLGLDPVVGEPRAERRHKHRAHPIGSAWNRIGLGMNQERLTHLIPGKYNLFIAGDEAFLPKITTATVLAEFRVDHRKGRVEKRGRDCTEHGGLQQTRHRNVVRVYSPA